MLRATAAVEDKRCKVLTSIPGYGKVTVEDFYTGMDGKGMIP